MLNGPIWSASSFGGIESSVKETVNYGGSVGATCRRTDAQARHKSASSDDRHLGRFRWAGEPYLAWHERTLHRSADHASDKPHLTGAVWNHRDGLYSSDLVGAIKKLNRRPVVRQLRIPKMTDSRATLVGWLRSEFAEEQGTNFARLKRVPDTQVIRFLDYFASLSSAQQSELITVLADWGSYGLSGMPLPNSAYEQFARVQAAASRNRAEGLRYTGVNLLAGLQKGASHGGLAGWFHQRGITGLAMQPPENLLRDVGDLAPVKIPTLRRLVKAAFAQRFAVNARDIGSEFLQYEGTLDEVSVKVLIRYSGKMGRPQLDYQVQVQDKGRILAVPNLCFESVLGVGFGKWDYLTQENAERSVELLCQLVEYVASLPERLPWG